MWQIDRMTLGRGVVVLALAGVGMATGGAMAADPPRPTRERAAAASPAVQAVQTPAPAAPSVPAAAVVNGVEIPVTWLQVLLAEAQAAGERDTPALRERLREDLIRRELLVQDAKARGINPEGLLKAQMDLAAQMVLVRTSLFDITRKQTIADDRVAAAYGDYKTRMGDTEFQVRHCLLESEEEAKGVIARVRAGERLGDIAAKQSRDPETRAKGGLASWVPGGALARPVFEVVSKMDKGQLSAPVRTDAGWQVLQLEDKRAFVAPTLEQATPGIRTELLRQGTDAYVNALREKAQVR